MFTKRNKFDNFDSLELGERAETLFAEIAINKGWEVSNASKHGNIHAHWDFFIKKDEKEFKVDVKSRKRISRSDADVQDKWIWIELHSVRESDRGWLFDGKADLIAFEIKASFIIVRRTDLIELVNKCVDLKNHVTHAKNAQYKVYSRRARPDKITLIETEKLKSIKFVEWSKFLINKKMDK